MRIRITRLCRATINGSSYAQLLVDHVYDLKDPIAAFLIGTGCAEPYQEPEVNTRSARHDFSSPTR
jgi:hypothetical protein